MKKQFKFLISALFPFIIFFNFSYSQFGDNFELDCPGCVVVESPASDVQNDPVVEQPTQIECGYDQHYSQWAGKCMKYCPNLSGEHEVGYSCPVQVDCGSGVFVTVPMSCPNVQQDTPVQSIPDQTTSSGPVWNTNSPYQTPPINPTNNGGVSITCRGDGQCGVGINWGGVNVAYNPSPTTQTTQTGGSVFVPTNWGVVSGTPPRYNPPVILPNPPRIVCPLNYTVNGQDCMPDKKPCTDGSQVNFFEQCTKTCWSGNLAGQRIPENQTCPAGTGAQQSNPPQTYNQPVIYNTPVRQVNNSTFVPTNWGVVSGNAQTYNTNNQVDNNTNVTRTKVCKDGNTVYDYQTCTRVCTDGKLINENYLCPTVRANHEVLTTSATQITNNSARCNAVADVVNQVNTTGYFEYGTTATLGKSTNSGNIGYGDDIYYSNTITNLEPDTKYYCRAVIVNKDGAYKGSIVSFRTNANKKVYVSSIIEEVTKKEIIASPVKKGVTKKVVQKKVEVTCKDTEGNTDSLEAGEKFLDMRLENVSNFISPLEVIDYKLGYKNVSKIKLENLLIKIKIPEGMTFVSSTDGKVEGEDIIIERSILKSNEDYVINFKLKADKNLTIGKNIIVQSNATYEMLDENGEIISDEASVYSISTVTDKATNLNTNTDKETESFWSGWLFKLLISLILLIILFILGKNIYKKIMHKRHSDRILGHH